MKSGIVSLAGGIALILLAVSASTAGEWRHSIGLSYVSNFGDIVDVLEDNKEAEGYVVDTSSYLPVGIFYRPYCQLDNGLGFGIGVGPIQMVLGDVELLNFPISADIRYKLFPGAKISPYARAGIAYNILSGDYVDSSTPGFLCGVGVEFNQQSAVGWGFELAYDASEIKMEKYTESNWSYRLNGTEEINPGVQISVFIIF